MALVVGPILTVINQGDDLVGDSDFNMWKALLTFFVPYAVATLSAVGAKRAISGRL